MKYGQIAGNASINAAIHRCFELISEEDQWEFARVRQEIWLSEK